MYVECRTRTQKTDLTYKMNVHLPPKNRSKQETPRNNDNEETPPTHNETITRTKTKTMYYCQTSHQIAITNKRQTAVLAWNKPNTPSPDSSSQGEVSLA